MKVKISTQGKTGSLNIEANDEKVKLDIKSDTAEISAEMSKAELRHQYLTATGAIPRKVDPPPFFTDNVRNPGVEQ
jgi:hypothetical protein